MPLEIRPPRPDEREAFLGPALRSWLDAYADHLSPTEVADAPAMLAHAWDERADAFRVAVLDGVILGYYSLGDPAHPERYDYLWHLYVDPAAQRQGVGRALNDAALAEIESRGATRAWLDVLRTNEKARAFYRALGWRETGSENGDYDVILMAYDLPQPG